MWCDENCLIRSDKFWSEVRSYSAHIFTDLSDDETCMRRNYFLYVFLPFSLKSWTVKVNVRGSVTREARPTPRALVPSVSTVGERLPCVLQPPSPQNPHTAVLPAYAPLTDVAVATSYCRIHTCIIYCSLCVFERSVWMSDWTLIRSDKTPNSD